MRGHTALSLARGLFHPRCIPRTRAFRPWTLTKGAFVLLVEPMTADSAAASTKGLSCPLEPRRGMPCPLDPRAACLNSIEPRVRCFGSGAFDQGAIAPLGTAIGV
jgi:hypothetical protein